MGGFLAAVVYFCVIVYKLVRHHPDTCEMMRKGYLYITSQENILEENPIYTFPINDSQVDISNLRQPRVNELLILPYPIETRMGTADIALPLLQFLFKFLAAFLVTVSFENSAAQLVLLMLITILNGLYFIVFKPYVHIAGEQYNNNMCIHNMVAYLLILTTMFLLDVLSNSLSYDQRVMLGNIVAALVVYSMTANVVYFAFRVYNWYFYNVWQVFVYSDLFKDNYTLQYWEYTKQYDAAKNDRKKNSGKRS